MDKEEDFFTEASVPATQQAKRLIMNAVKDPFGHLLGLSFYIVSIAAGIWCVIMALSFAASILSIY